MTKSRFTGRIDPSPINSAERRRTGRIMLAGGVVSAVYDGINLYAYGL